MRSAIKFALVLALCYGTSTSASVSRNSAPSPDEFWIDKYGSLRWEDEKARLDNLAIQLNRDPNLIGYITIWAGNRSCAGDAVAHAIKARRYLTEVRHVPWNRIAFRDLGYRDSFTVMLWLFPRDKPPFILDYEPPTPNHVIQKCSAAKTRTYKSRAPRDATWCF